MNFFKHLSIRNKLIFITLIPLLALVYFLSEAIIKDLKQVGKLRSVYEDVLEIEAITDLTHQITQERGFSITYMATKGLEERGELLSQREQTNKSVASLKALLREQNKGKPLSFLDSLPVMRGKVNLFESDTDSINSNMLQLNESLLDEVNETLRTASDVDIYRLQQIHLSLVGAKAQLGELRSYIYLATLSNGLNKKNYREFARMKGSFESSLQRFRQTASPELSAQAEKMIQQDPAVRLSFALIDSVYNHGGSDVPFSSDIWRMNTTSFLNSLKDLQDLSAAAIKGLAEEKLSAVRATLTRNVIIAIALVLLIGTLLYFIVNTIVSSISQIREAANKISKGDLDFVLSVDSHDEVGELAASFGELIKVTREYSSAAEAVGNGDYTVAVNVRGDKDTLGHSLVNMRDNLHSLSLENRNRTWLLTGSGELNDRIRGEKEVSELAQEVVTQLCSYLGAQIGAIYLSENDALHLVGSYAFHHRKNNTNLIKPGQGLVGQAALEKKPIVFSPVPDDYVKINSGLGETSPKTIVVYPFMFDGLVNGVIELGFVNDFTDLDMQFLGLVVENVGIAFNSSQSRTQLKELLEETQRQAEELETQQEELRQTNEELEEKTELLEKSQVELRTQQEELQQTNEELEEKAELLEKQRDKLEVAKMDVETKARELEITSKYKSEFLANMSHELRTPLNSILILAQILAENKNQALGEKEVEFAQNINNSGKDLLNLINEILDLSKVESGKIELEIAEVNIDSICENIRSTFKEIANNKKIEFHINDRHDESTGAIASDEERLEQILRNLLSNAFKFTESGGSVTLDIRSIGKKELQDSGIQIAGEAVAFTVTDNGPGIPENKQTVIFEAFQQADGSTKRKYGGTGLGLSISRELAHALGGEISLESEEGKGSTFTLYLPIEFSEAGSRSKEKKVEYTQTRKKDVQVVLEEPVGQRVEADDDRHIIEDNDKVILIVEDDPQFSNVLRDFVREKGYRAIQASQGNVGLSLAKQYHPDAIILDMKLPVMDGALVLKHLKNDPGLRHIPVQIISGYDHRKEGIELGAFDFLRKPISKNDLSGAFGRIEEFITRPLKRLLIVEDDKQLNKAIKELIGNGDVNSFSAYTGEEAYSMMQKEKLDCIIIDLGLPDMGGIDLMERIKSNGELNKIPIIVYTGKDLTKEEAVRLDKLANTVVLKTVDSTERLLDETILFLHRVESSLPKEKQEIIRSLHRTEEVLKGKKILIVDDDMRNIYSLTNALEEEGLGCISAENGISALKILNEHPDTDIILMDVMMPEMDGFEATREIRKIDKFSKIPIIALTAKAMKGDREKCLDAGMSDYVSKPVNVSQLLSLMRVWLYK